MDLRSTQSTPTISAQTVPSGRRIWFARLCSSIALVGLLTINVRLQADVTFERDVMVVLSKGGCNAGTCHGNINGKGGFFLSLRGQDPLYDYTQLVRAQQGRRVNRINPDSSLILSKSTGQVAHGGGKRFAQDSPEYEILRAWIANGTTSHDSSAPTVTHLQVTPEDEVLWHPQAEVPLTVQAHFSDGSHRDVTRLAVYEPNDPLVTVTAAGVVQFAQPGSVTVLVRYLDGQSPVRIAYRSPTDNFVWADPQPNHFIDEIVFQRLEQLKINPANQASDAVFLRRIYLDLLGILPDAATSRKFVADPSTDKREALVDQLLTRPEFATRWAQKWSDVLRNEEKTLDATGVEKYHRWMEASFAQDKPLNQFVAELIASRGSTYNNPPANYWRAHREPFVRAETTAQVFLGVRLQCAKCHNHPFDRWSQDEYYNWSALFADIDYEVVENKRRDKLDKHEFVGEQIVNIKQGKPVKNARTGKSAVPRFLGQDETIGDDRLKQLSEWLTSPDNRMFARAQANRIWYHIMGRGLVEPIDDLRDTNPASHPELLKRLTDEFIEHNFSTRHLVRTIVLSKSYQLASSFAQPQLSETEYDEQLYARAVIRRLTAEQILDAQSHVLGLPARFKGYEAGTAAGQIAGVERVRRKEDSGDRFLKLFGKPERLLACECERSDQPTLGQALSLVGGASLNERLAESDNRIGRLLKSEKSPAECVDELFWTALVRSPTPAESAAIVDQINTADDPRQVLEDVTWALLNAKELLFRN